MAGGAERDLLGRIGGIGLVGVVRRDQARHIDQQFVRGRLARQGMKSS